MASKQEPVPARQRRSRVLTEYFAALAGQEINSGFIRIQLTRPGAGFALFGTRDLSVLSAVPAQKLVP